MEKTTKTVVVKTADGTEETVKYTGKTAVEGNSKDAGNGVAKGSAKTYLAGKKGSRLNYSLHREGG